MRLSQPDRRSCGAACLVMARRLMDDEFRTRTDDQRRFGSETLALHRTLTALSSDGRAQAPWVRALGTPPWAVVRHLSALTGAPYRTHVVTRRGETSLHLAGATSQRPVVAYVGSRWLPRHVVLVVEADAEGTWVYEPASGRVQRVPHRRWNAGRLRLAGWDRPWLLVRPVSTDCHGPVMQARVARDTD